MITPERLREVLHYDPVSGSFTWLKTLSGHAIAGRVVKTCLSHGYRVIRIDKRLYPAHRLAWLHIHGRWPREQIDHINGDRHDNRFCNLREATDAQNRQNMVRSSSTASGLTGVTWEKAPQKWRARVKVNGRCMHLGLFETPEEAHAAYIAGKAKFHTFNPIPRAA